MGSRLAPLYWAFSSASRNRSSLLRSSLLPQPAFIPPFRCSFLAPAALQKRNWRHHNKISLLYVRRNYRVSSSQVGVGVKVEDEGVISEDDDIEEEEEACELVSRIELSIGDGDDTIAAYLCKAVKNNNGIGILLLSDIFGFQDSATRDFAYRVACNGYNVLVPDLFQGDPWTKERSKELFEEWYARQYSERVIGDILTSANWLANEHFAASMVITEGAVSSKKLGIIGFGFGGGHMINNILFQEMGHLFETGVSFYGTQINTTCTSSSLLMVSVPPPVLLILGDNDHLCPNIDALKTLEQEIKGWKVVVFKGRGHGFAHRPESLEEDEDAEAAFLIMRNWLHDNMDVDVDK